jgi:hypothetical protein
MKLVILFYRVILITRNKYKDHVIPTPKNQTTDFVRTYNLNRFVSEIWRNCAPKRHQFTKYDSVRAAVISDLLKGPYELQLRPSGATLLTLLQNYLNCLRMCHWQRDKQRDACAVEFLLPALATCGNFWTLATQIDIQDETNRFCGLRDRPISLLPASRSGTLKATAGVNMRAAL